MAQTDPSSSDADGDQRGLDDFYSNATQEHEFSIQISYDILSTSQS